MRILHLLDHSIPLHSGYTFRTRAILEAQRDMGWTTLHLTSAKQGGGAEREEEVDGLHFFRTPSAGMNFRLPVVGQWQVVSSLERRLEEILPQTLPDLLHAHSPALNGMAAARVASRHRLPMVYECRAFWEDAAVDHGTSREGGARYRLTRWLETKVFRRADAVTTICEGLRRDILGRGIPGDRVTVIPNAVEADRFTFRQPADAQLRSELGLGEGPVLGFLGSFYAYEGLDLLLQAAARIREHAPGLRLLLVGGGPEESTLRARVSEHSLDDLVRMTGRVPHDQVQRFYSLVDLCVYPRRSMRLTELVTPLKPLEAMAQGKIVVASDVGGHRELIADGETGFLFAAGDPDALGRKILEVLELQDRWDGIRESGRRFVERERTWASSVARYDTVYAQATASVDNRRG